MTKFWRLLDTERVEQYYNFPLSRHFICPATNYPFSCLRPRTYRQDDSYILSPHGQPSSTLSFQSSTGVACRLQHCREALKLFALLALAVAYSHSLTVPTRKFHKQRAGRLLKAKTIESPTRLKALPFLDLRSEPEPEPVFTERRAACESDRDDNRRGKYHCSVFK